MFHVKQNAIVFKEHYVVVDPLTRTVLLMRPCCTYVANDANMDSCVGRY